MLMNLERARVSTGGISELHDFTVEVNGVMFRAAIDGLYGDKIKAPIREYCTNAFDSHVRAGKADIPFEVQLPSNLDPTFRVRDYGSSLSHEQVLTLFTRLYASDKRGIGCEVGGLGLGCKSGFAYASSFTVTVWKGGFKRIYLCFLGAKGFPQCTVEPPESSQEPDGVEIQLPVKRQDIEAFKASAEKVFLGFRPRPRLLNEAISLKDPEIVLAGNGWTIYRESHGPLARQGCVLYPIEPAKMKLSAYSPPPVYTLPIIVDFPMNTLQFTTSREALGYDDRTIVVISERMTEIAAELTAKCQASIEALPTYAAACRYWTEHKDYSSKDKELWSRFGSQLKWRGRELSSTLIVRQDKVRFHLLSQRTLEAANPFPAFVANSRSYTRPILSLNDLLVVLELPGLDKPRHRMRRLLLPGFPRNQHILWVRAPDEASFKEFLRELAEPKWVDLADYEPAQLTRPATAGASGSAFCWRYGRKCQTSDFDPAQGGIYVLRKDHNAFGFAGRTASSEEIGQIVRMAINAGLMTQDQPVWFFTKKHHRFVKAHQTWLSLDHHLKAELATHFDPSAYLAGQDLRELVASPETRYIKSLDIPDLPKPIARFKDSLTRLPRSSDNQRPELAELYTLIEPQGLASAPFNRHRLWAELEAIRAQWPLLPLLAHAAADAALARHYFTLNPQ